jgi:hypothetical protein
MPMPHAIALTGTFADCRVTKALTSLPGWVSFSLAERRRFRCTIWGIRVAYLTRKCRRRHVPANRPALERSRRVCLSFGRPNLPGSKSTIRLQERCCRAPHVPMIDGSEHHPARHRYLGWKFCIRSLGMGFRRESSSAVVAPTILWRSSSHDKIAGRIHWMKN